MAKGTKLVRIGLFCLVFAASVVMTGCSRYANEKQLSTLDESEAAASSAEARVAELEGEKAELEAKLEKKQQDLAAVKAENKKVEAELAE